MKKAWLKSQGYADLSAWVRDPRHEYIGRNMVFYVGPGAAQSKWSNPFLVKKHGRKKCLELYRSWVVSGVNPLTKKRRKGGPLFAELGELRGKVLGCWCKPEACHGDVLQELLAAGRDAKK